MSIVLPIIVDPPRFCAEELEAFKKPVIVKKGHKATFKLPYVGRDPIKIQWYLDGEELSDESNIKLEHTEGSTRLLLSKLQRKDSGEVKIKLKNEFGTIEAFSQLVVTGMYTNIILQYFVCTYTVSGLQMTCLTCKSLCSFCHALGNLFSTG